MPISVALPVINHRSTSILICTWCTGGERHREGEILEDNNVLIDVKSILRVGDTLFSWILKSDRTHLSTFAGNNKEWPVHMTIGNLSLKIRQMPSTHTIIMVTLLRIPIKNCHIPQKRLDVQR